MATSIASNHVAKIVCSILFAMVTSLGYSQTQSRQPYRAGHTFDVAATAAGGQFSAALSWSHLHPIALKNRVQVGYGIRLTSFIGANKYYTTAPAKFTSPVQNLTTIFSNTIAENIDTITTATASTNAVNIALHIQYSITSKLNFGFNIDAAGFSFGAKKDFNIISSSFDQNQSPLQAASPTKLNLLLTSDNDIGTLNSEFFLAYWVTTKLAIRGGYTFLFSEYRTDRALSFKDGEIVNDRYRYKSSMALLAISFKPFNYSQK
jgi:hypothetical protein